MTARGYPAEFAERCFNQIKGFGEYGFPESHAASFAHLVYVSAWIKCHYPAAFAAALLNAQPMGFYAPAQIVRCAREHGVEAREADVNLSLWDCTLEPVEVAAQAPPPLEGEGGATFGRAGWGEYPCAGVTPHPDAANRRRPPPRGGGGARRVPDKFALRLGMRQIDGLREDDVQRLVSIRDCIAADLNPHLFAPSRPTPSLPLMGRAAIA